MANESTQFVAMSIHPQIIEKNGKKEFVVLPYEEFLLLEEELEDFQDLKTFREEKVLAEHGARGAPEVENS